MFRAAVFIFGLLLAAQAFPSTFVLATVEETDLRLSADGRRLSIDGYESVGIGGGYELAAKTWFIRLQPGELPEDIALSAGDSSALPYTVSNELLSDLATSDSIPYHDFVASSARIDRVGRRPIIRSLRVDGDDRWVVVTLFPVTVGDDGRLVLHSRVTADVADREVFLSDLRTDDPSFDDAKDNPATRSTSAISNFLIVTSAELLAPMEELAEYRSSLGYQPEIALIGDVTATYPGRDDAEKLRNYLRDYHNRGGDYVLLAGDETLLPVRYAYHYSVSALPPMEELLLCDLYFAEVMADWDPDNDNIFGERDISLASVSPQLRVGRLPFSQSDEAAAYVRKLIAYETDPGNGSYDYLDRAFFYASDQMRDLGDGGQHGAIASVYPAGMQIDTTTGVESTTGQDIAPGNPSAEASLDILGDGYGIVNIIAHGRSDAFGVTTSGYNEWPKTYFITDDFGSPHGDCRTLPDNNRLSFYYSLACDIGGFDQDQPPMNRTGANLAETLLGLDSAGAVGFVAYSRWGWVGSSYLLQRAYFEELFADPAAPAVDAMYKSLSRYYYYRDLVYSQNFLGDPALRVYAATPSPLTVTLSVTAEPYTITAWSNGNPVIGCSVMLSSSAGVIQEGVTDNQGQITLTAPLDGQTEYTLTGQKDGHVTFYTRVRPSIATDVDDDSYATPSDFALHQNYPNPFNPSTTLSFSLPSRSHVTLSVYNILGQHVATIADGSYTVGTHEMTWDATDESGASVASGLYFYRLETDAYSESRKMLLLR